MSKAGLILCGLLAMVLLFSTAVGQEAETVFGGDTELSFAWGMDLKVNSIQKKTGTLFEIFGGALVDRSIIVGLAAGMNLGHPTVNYGYLGLLGHYTLNPRKLIHFSSQLILGMGSARDYQWGKSSLFDNFGNISGPSFFLIEPSLLAEVNLSQETRLFLGLGYRYVTGLDEDDALISKTKVTNEDLSGINGILGVKFGLY